ncbi:MAG: biotin/lipoate A/B protein ligase family protein [Limisphaerales bacterium]
MNAEGWLILDSGPGDSAENMALDEALLASAGPRGVPVLRFYGWKEPAATFGYFQRYLEIEQRTPLRPLIRRPTGGGIVPHDRDWTYSLAIPPGHAWHRLRAIESYRTVHAWVIRALAEIGVASELAPCCRKEIPGACFEGYEMFDVLRAGRKIAGAAQRRNASGLLIQGSVQPPPGADRAKWLAAMAAHRPPLFAGDPGTFSPDPALLEAAGSLARSKYSRPEYNKLR